MARTQQQPRQQHHRHDRSTLFVPLQWLLLLLFSSWAAVIPNHVVVVFVGGFSPSPQAHHHHHGHHHLHSERREAVARLRAANGNSDDDSYLDGLNADSDKDEEAEGEQQQQQPNGATAAASSAKETTNDNAAFFAETTTAATTTATKTGASSSGSTDQHDSDKNWMYLQSLGAITGRGEFATEEQKRSAATVIGELEKGERYDGGTTTSEEEASSALLLQGRWELVYADTQLFRSSPFFMAGRAVCTTQERGEQYNWFCDLHRQALRISQIGAVRQIVDAAAGTLTSEFEVNVGAVPFLSDLTPFSYSGGMPVSITGAIVSSADFTDTTTTTANDDSSDYPTPAWELYMDTVNIKGSNIPGLRQVLDLPEVQFRSRRVADALERAIPDYYTTPRPVFRHTCLHRQQDDDGNKVLFRISRDQDDHVFVYVKTSDDPSLTDYGNVDSDLGLLKLLEGFNDAVTRIQW